MSVQILIGDALSRLRELPDASVHCCITSPPYWGLRAYGGDPGMIGLEATFAEHLDNLVAVFREVRRVLRDDGTCWLNYGDAYTSGDRATYRSGASDNKGHQVQDGQPRPKTPTGLKPKDLMMMPARVAMALQDDGWWLRSEIIWHKPNPMPESATDRPTSSHEKLFLLSKAPRYFYDAEAVRTRGANLRNIWTIATQAYPGAHFATFPEALVIPCIKAGTSEKGVCAECGAPWAREVESKTRFESGSGKAGNVPAGKYAGTAQAESGDYDIRMGPVRDVMTTGWHQSCTCRNPTFGSPVIHTRPATVLDPFAGSGTVGLVADKLGRDAILIEISEDYADMARRRIQDDAPLFAEVGP